jgi:MutS-like protein
MIDPGAEYSRRADNHRRTVASREKVHRQIGHAKLTLVIAGLAIAWLYLDEHLFSAYWLLAPVAAFAALAVCHEHVLRTKNRAESTVAFYDRGIARLEDRWAGRGETGERFRDPKHDYSDDLDLFGPASLFQLLCSARLPMGENFLARWLCSPSAPGAVVARQGMVMELRQNLDLRESLAVTGTELRTRIHPESLARWSQGQSLAPLSSGALRAVCAALSILAFAALIFSLATVILWPLVSVLIVESLIFGWLHRHAEAAVAEISANAEGLLLFSRLLGRIAHERFESAYLQELMAQLKRGGTAAPDALRGLARIVFWIDARDSVIGRFLNVTMLYTVQAAFAAEAWRRRYGAKLQSWLDIAGEMEALLSLAAYSFEHPGDPFPEFSRQVAPPPLFDGEELAHPLIPAAQCVPNSVHLGEDMRLLLVSGSNMSGKSTFLRTVGINAVLANAGAPIRGKALRLSPLVLGTRIRSTDSLQEGRSNFYTEILRIRQVFERMDHGLPLLFLFDELLEGTNSKDRRIGAQGLLRALMDRGAIGIVTTHDLALTEITHSLGTIARNAHFEDFVQDGAMRFDYKLRDGVVAKSNALELMRLIGLKV